MVLVSYSNLEGIDTESTQGLGKDAGDEELALDCVPFVLVEREPSETTAESIDATLRAHGEAAATGDSGTIELDELHVAEESEESTDAILGGPEEVSVTSTAAGREFVDIALL